MQELSVFYHIAVYVLLAVFRRVYQTTENEFIECFQDEKKIVTESNHNKAPFFACMVDESADISEETQYKETKSVKQ